MRDAKNVRHWYGISVISSVMTAVNTSIRNALVITLNVRPIDVKNVRSAIFVINQKQPKYKKWSNAGIVWNHII